MNVERLIKAKARQLGVEPGLVEDALAAKFVELGSDAVRDLDESEVETMVMDMGESDVAKILRHK